MSATPATTTPTPGAEIHGLPALEQAQYEQAASKREKRRAGVVDPVRFPADLFTNDVPLSDYSFGPNL